MANAESSITVGAERMACLGLATEPMGYVDGLNDYQGMGDNPINGMDPTGLARIVIAFDGLFGYNYKNLSERNAHTSILNPLYTAGIKVNADWPSGDVTDKKRDYVLYFAGDQSGTGSDAGSADTAIQRIKELHLANKGCGGFNTFVVAGHSFGGGMAWAFGQKFREAFHAKLNLGFTLDPRDPWNLGILNGDENGKSPWKGPFPGWSTQPAAHWINYYQKTEIKLNGYNIGDDSTEVTKEMWPQINHYSITWYMPAIDKLRTALTAVGYSQKSLPAN